jgi:hypothetical protein
MTPANSEVLIKFIDRLPVEIQVATIKGLSGTAALSTKAVAGWFVKNSNVFL